MTRPLHRLSLPASALGLLLTALGVVPSDKAEAADPLSVIVMDPLAAPLSCPCVKGYAQREYEALAKHLEKQLGQPVRLTFSESLKTALKGDAKGKADLVIGKYSVVLADAVTTQQMLQPLAALSGKDGSTTQSGLIVVPAQDPAQKVTDLNGYRILFGPTECDEKHAAAMGLLKSKGVQWKLGEGGASETCSACSDGATKILELGGDIRVATVISSYAQPLLQGCGTIKKGDLRVVAETAPVPFVTAFVHADLPKAKRDAIQSALFQVGEKPELCTALETLVGFLPFEPPAPEPPAKKARTLAADQPLALEDEKPAAPAEARPNLLRPESWPQWRGANRDGRVAKLPDFLLPAPLTLWERPLAHAGLGGVAVQGKHVVLGDRDLADLSDVVRCYAADTGKVLWEHAYPAPGELDYGQTPRSTPLIVGDAVIMQGAMGHVTALDLATGQLRWQRDFAVEAPPVKHSEWGACSSPISFGDWVIVNPGAKDTSLAALSLKDGSTAWKSPGTAAGHGSFILAKLGGVQQLVGFDSESLGGWEPRTGRRLWTLKPTIPGDFNVPTPLPIDDQLLIATENNGTRRYAFDDAGRIKPQPVAENQFLAPDMSSLIHSKGRVYCVWHELFCLDAGTLKQQWSTKHEKLQDYGACFATDNRLLVVGRGGHLLLFDTTTPQAKLLGELDVLPDDDAENYSHPALVGDRLYLRGAKRLVCVALQ